MTATVTDLTPRLARSLRSQILKLEARAEAERRLSDELTQLSLHHAQRAQGFQVQADRLANELEAQS